MIDDIARVLAAGDPSVWRTLLADHVPDQVNRCRRCPVGNGSGHQLWPCRLHIVADAARSLADAQ